jgi:hypothetical protein
LLSNDPSLTILLHVATTHGGTVLCATGSLGLKIKYLN